MLIKELINYLAKFDGNLEVMINYGCEDEARFVRIAGTDEEMQEPRLCSLQRESFEDNDNENLKWFEEELGSEESEITEVVVLSVSENFKELKKYKE